MKFFILKNTMEKLYLIFWESKELTSHLCILHVIDFTYHICLKWECTNIITSQRQGKQQK